MKYFLIFILLYNLFTFSMMGIDKYKSSHKKYRISEKFLLTMGIFLGAFGAFLGMGFFHHKTKKFYFKIVFILEILLNIAIIYMILKYFKLL